MDQFSLGDIVIVNKDKLKNERGQIKYIGELDGKQGQYYGIELENEVGNHTGSYQDKHYFQCPDKHGIFITGQYISKPSLKSRDDTKKSTKILLKDKDKAKQDAPKDRDNKKKITKKEIVKIPKQKEGEDQEKQEMIQKQKQLEKQQEEEARKQQEEELRIQQEQEERERTKQLEEEQQQIALEANEEIKKYKQQMHGLTIINNDLKSQITNYKRKIDQLEKELDQNLEDMNDYESLIVQVETLKQEKEQFNYQKQELEIKIKNQAETIKVLEEEKILQELELEEAIWTAGSNVSGGGQSSLEAQELSMKNGKLQLALQRVQEQLVREQEDRQREVEQLNNRIEGMKQMTEKALKYNKLESQIQKYQEEIQELSQRLDDSSQLQDLIESMTDTLLKKDEAIENLKNQIKEQNELKKVDQELIQCLEETVTDYEQKIDEQDLKVDQLNNQIQKMIQDFDEKEQMILRLKNKIIQQNKLLEQQKDISVVVENETKGSDELQSKNQELVSLNRELYRKYLKSNVEIIEIRNQIGLKGIMIYKALPQEYTQKLKFNLLESMITVKRVSEKSQLIAEELLLTVENQGEKFIKEENQELAFWMLECHKHLIKLNNVCQIFYGYVQSQKELEPVEKVTRNVLLINQFKGADTQLDYLIQLIQTEKISPQVQLANLAAIVTRLNDEISQIYIKEQYEQQGVMLMEQLNQIIYIYNYAIFNYKVILDSQQLGKTVELDQLIDTMLKRSKEQLRQLKYSKIGWGTFEWLIQKNSSSYIQLVDLFSDLLNIVTDMKIEDYDQFILGKCNEEDQVFRDKCISIVHLLNQINQHFEESNLIDEFSSNRQNQFTQHSISQNSLWWQLQKELKVQLQDIQYTIQNEKRLMDDLSKVNSEKTQLQNEAGALKSAREALESRVVQLQLKADKVQGLENEKNRLLEKIKGYQQASDSAKKEFDNLENRLKESEDQKKLLEEQIREYQKQQMSAQHRMLESAQQRVAHRMKSSIVGGSNAHSSTNLDNEQQEQLIPLYTKGLEVTLFKENQKIKLQQLRDKIVEVTSESYINYKNKGLAQLRLLKLNQLTDLAQGKVSEEWKIRASQIYSQQLQNQKTMKSELGNRGVLSILQNIIIS